MWPKVARFCGSELLLVLRTVWCYRLFVLLVRACSLGLVFILGQVRQGGEVVKCSGKSASELREGRDQE